MTRFRRQNSYKMTRKLPGYLVALWVILMHISYARSQDDIFTVSYSIREQAFPGTLIGNVVQDSSIQTRYDSDVIDTFEFSFLNGPYNRYFQIANNGDFSTQESINRESADVCPYLETCQVLINVVVRTAAGYVTEIEITVTIEDRNDYTPTFVESSMTLDISESTPVGLEVTLTPAQDLEEKV